MNCGDYTIPSGYQQGEVYDFAQFPPYSKCFNDTANLFSDPEQSLSDALYPSSLDLFFKDLHPELDASESTFYTTCVGERYQTFNGIAWSVWTNNHWEIPLVCITLYIACLYFIPICMKNREPMKLRGMKTLWNFGLSAFSTVGFFVTSRHLLFNEYSGVLTVGLYPSICMHATNYGCGLSGIGTAAFIYSKCFELIDTVFILLSKREPIFLHWYHHITVLAFCWYAYSVKASNGIYFAVVNYSVHAIMYFYYGMTQLSQTTRKMVLPYAFYITLVQLSQMVFGLGIVGMTVYYRYQRMECYTYPNVNMFAVLMYFSYFLLFLQIFLSRYVCTKKKSKAKRA